MKFFNKKNLVTVSGLIYSIAGLMFNIGMTSFSLQSNMEAFSIISGIITIVAAVTCAGACIMKIVDMYKGNKESAIELILRPDFLYNVALIILIALNYKLIQYCGSTLSTASAIGGGNYGSALNSGLDTVSYFFDSDRYMVLCGFTLTLIIAYSILSAIKKPSTESIENQETENANTINAITPIAENESSSNAIVPRREIKKLNKKTKIAIAATAAVVAVTTIVITAVTCFGPTKVDPMEYVNKVNFKGYNGEGEVSYVDISDDSLYLDGEVSEEDTRILAALESGKFKVDDKKDGSLSNGDKVTVYFTYDEDVAEENRVEFTRTSKKYKVSGLTCRYSAEDFDKDTIDQFADDAESRLEDYLEIFDFEGEYELIGVFFRRAQEIGWLGYNDELIALFECVDDGQTDYYTVRASYLIKGDDISGADLDTYSVGESFVADLVNNSKESSSNIAKLK